MIVLGCNTSFRNSQRHLCFFKDLIKQLSLNDRLVLLSLLPSTFHEANAYGLKLQFYGL